MANLPSDLEKILQEETEFEQPVSEAVAQKMGSSINALIDAVGDPIIYNTSGSFSYVVPANVTRITFHGCGAGGGGGGGKSRSTGVTGNGGQGGKGAEPKTVRIPVTPGQTLSITIPVGGAGGLGELNGTPATNGSAGGATTVTGTGVNVYFAGAEGGIAGQNSVGTSDWLPYGSTSGGGLGGTGSPGSAGSAGVRSSYAAGGTAGGSGAPNGGGGGGGGASIGAGGNGGNGVNSGTPNVGTAGTKGGGGGGGGGNGDASAGADGGDGGAAGSGYLELYLR